MPEILVTDWQPAALTASEEIAARRIAYREKLALAYRIERAKRGDEISTATAIERVSVAQRRGYLPIDEE